MIGTVDGVDVVTGMETTVGNYLVTTANGTLAVNPKAVTITASDTSKTYDGSALTSESYTSSALAIGDVIESVTLTGNQTLVGSSSNVPSAAVIKTLNGEMRNENYVITYVNGTLAVTPNTSTITVMPANGSKTYDGTPLTKTAHDDFTVTGLPAGFTWSATADGTVTNVVPGTGEKSVNAVTEFKIFNASNEDVTNQFSNINTSATGTLTVSPKSVTITVDNASKTFAESDPAFSGTVNGLVNATDIDAITYIRTNTDEAVGTYDDVLTASYTDNSNYTVMVDAGDFTINCRDITMKSGVSWPDNITGQGNSFANADTTVLKDAMEIKNLFNNSDDITVNIVDEAIETNDCHWTWLRTYTLYITGGCTPLTRTMSVSGKATKTEQLKHSICQGESYLWNENPRTESGEYTYTTTSVEGCDSVATLQLTVNPVYNTPDVYSVCDSLLWYGVKYTESTSAVTHTLSTVAGCDSVMTLNLTIRHSNTGVDNQNRCDSYRWIDGNTYTTSNNIATHTMTNAAGCDSTVTLNLTLHYSSTGVEAVTACNSYTWHGTTYTGSTNTLTYTCQNAVGCDSVTILHLTINAPVHETFTDTACEMYTWQGTDYSVSGDYTYSHTDANGCTQVDTLHLTINNPLHMDVTDTACESYTWHGTAYTVSGNYTYSHADANGCTQVDTLHLTINHSNAGFETVTTCDSYTWHGITYTNSTSTPTYTCTNAAGCDSVTTLQLTVKYSTSAVEMVTACNNYEWHGNIYSSSTDTPTFTTINAEGCDSVTTLHLTIGYAYAATDTVTACERYVWHGTAYTVSTNEPTYTVPGQYGCDSVYTLHLTIHYSSFGIDKQEVCDSLTWHGILYNYSTNTPTFITTNAAGCDSTIILHLEVNYSANQYDTLVISQSQLPYDYNGYLITHGGDVIINGTTIEGCDSVVHLHVMFMQDIEIVDAIENVIVYPNPTHGMLTIGVDDVLKVEVMDVVGRLVAVFRNTNILDISNLEDGTYTLRITLPQGTIIRKVMKR